MNIEKFAPVIIVVAIIAALLANSVVIVESGYVGVIRTLGAVQMEPLKEGFHFRKPFIDKIEQMDMRLTTESAAAQAASKDLQIVTTDVTVQYALVDAVAPQTFQKLGLRDVVAKRLIEPAIQESVKAITAKFTAEELVTNRAEVKLKIHEAIDEFIDKTLEKKGVVGAIDLANVAITDFNFSEEFNRAIEMKVKAEQEALQAQNEKVKLITQAEAAAETVKLEADAQAYLVEANSVARADAITREAEALSGRPEVIQLRTIEKWTGEVPKFVGAGSVVPFIDIDSMGDTGK